MNLGGNWIDFFLQGHKYPAFQVRIVVKQHLGVSRLKQNWSLLVKFISVKNETVWSGIRFTKLQAELFTCRGRCKGEAVAHEAVVNYREPTQPNPGYKEGSVVRSVRPKGERC